MLSVELDQRGVKANNSSGMYDLSKDRRVANRRDTLIPCLEGMQHFERRNVDDRRRDNRPLNEFPFLPEVIL